MKKSFVSILKWRLEKLGCIIMRDKRHSARDSLMKV